MVFERLGRCEPAATLAGFAFSPMTATRVYESLAREGQTKTVASMVRYAYDQVDQARTSLNPTAEFYR
jgi:hypothetical protein